MSFDRIWEAFANYLRTYNDKVEKVRQCGTCDGTGWWQLDSVDYPCMECRRDDTN